MAKHYNLKVLRNNEISAYIIYAITFIGRNELHCSDNRQNS